MVGLLPHLRQILENGRIFGRGAIDDKGPVISSLYAMKAVKDNFKLNSRIRLILGVNEEKDWKCIKHYKETEELPTVGFSPDADFPCIHAEKGILTLYIKEDYSKYSNLPIKITDINCKNNAINVVPKYCSVRLDLNPDEIDLADAFNFISDTIRNLNFDFSYTTNENTIYLTSRGVQAHAAHPALGKNAISQMLILLNRLYKHFNLELNILDFFEKHIGTEYNGKSLNIDLEDESGNLTLNVGHFKFYENHLQIGLNLRIPVNTSITDIANKISKTCSNYNLETLITGKQEPLYVPKDNFLVKTLTNIFNKATNSNLDPVAIGGGTYARAFKNCVSFGANFPGDTDMCHQANEFVEIDKLILACKIYAEAIYELGK